MARIKHRKVKKLIYEETNSITDRVFFLSRELQAYLQDILDVISCSYDTKQYVRISLDWDTDEHARVAYTDSQTLHINAGTFLMKDITERAERFEGVLGLMLHENGHLLYTNFQKSQEIANAICNSHILMCPDKNYTEVYEAYVKVRDYMSTIKNKDVLRMICQIWHYISNSLEDGHVDWRVGARYPGYKPYLEFVNDLAYEQLPTVSEVKLARLEKKQKEPDEPVFMIYDFLQYLLMYSRHGFIKGEDREIAKEEAALKVYDMIDWIDFAKEEKNSETRLMYQSIVFYLAFPFDYVDSLLAQYGNEDTSTVSQDSQNSLSDTLQGTQKGQGLSNMSGDQLPSSVPSGSPIGDSKEATANQQPSKQEESDTEQTGTGSNQEEQSGSSEGSSTEGQNQGLGGSASSQPTEVTEQDEKSDAEKASVLSQHSGGKKDKEKGLKTAGKDMQRVLDKIRKNENLRARERHLESELNTFAAAVKHRGIHKDVKCGVRRIEQPCEELMEAYHSIWPQISPISKRLQGKLKKHLEKKRKGYTQKNLYFGRRLDASALPRSDGKCFSKKQLPANKKEIAVALLVDESGSMRLADRITHARITSLILYDFCEKLGLPIAVYGHSAGHPEVRLNAYAEFDAIDKNDRYRIMNMDCDGCNRDGYALRYMADRLLTQDADVKLLFIISDGKPADTRYCGPEAYEDLASIKKEYRSKGIITLAAAIGDDKDTIEHIYGKEAFLDVSDLEQLPDRLIEIVKKYL